MRVINARESLTDREREEFDQEKTLVELQADYQLRFKALEVELQRQEMRWTQLFRLPLAIIMLPVRFLFGIAYIVFAIRGTTPEEKFWDYLRHL